MTDKLWIKVYDRYFISNFGDIRNIDNKIMKTHKNKDGYLRLKLFKNKKPIMRSIHSLVLEAFLSPRPKNLTCNHKDGNKLNNYIRNLEWLTMEDNNKHAYRTGLKNHKGENHPQSKFKQYQINAIRKLAKEGVKQKIIAKKYNTKQPRISEIVLYKTWKKV